MSEAKPSLPRLDWPLRILAVATVLILGAYGWARYRASQGEPLPVIGQVSGFVLTNQFGQAVSTKALAGQVWIADLIFTRCPGPCLKMTRNLVQIQNRIPQDRPVRFVSLTADPDFDTPEVLKTYAARFGADGHRWDFLTGPRTNINRIATQQLLLAVQEKDPAQRETPEDLFLHSTTWVLVDRQGRLRSVYEGTEPASVTQAVRDIERLLRETSP